MGIHEVHYAMVVILSMGIGLFAPPFGVGYYAACAIGRVAPEQGVRPIMGYLASIAVGIVIVATVPWISTGFLSEARGRASIGAQADRLGQRRVAVDVGADHGLEGGWRAGGGRESCSRKATCTSGRCMMRATATLMRSITAGGVAAGASKPCHWSSA